MRWTLAASLATAAGCTAGGTGDSCTQVVASLTPTSTDERITEGLSEVVLFRGDDPARTLTGDWVATRPSLSPDGREVAVVRADGDNESAGPGATTLWAIPVDGGEPRRLVEGDDRLDDAPAWSPDGEEIAFSALSDDGSGTAAIAVVPSEGGTPRTLAEVPGRTYRSPAWSPDGETVAFVVQPSGVSGAPAAEVWTVGADGASPRHVATVLGASAIDWHPDGDRLLVSAHPQGGVAVVDATDGTVEVVSTEGGPATWSGDGSSVVWLAPDDGTGRRVWGLARGRIDGGSIVSGDALGGPEQFFLYPDIGVDAGPCPGRG